MVLRSFWRQNQLHGTHSFQENTILVNQFGWYKILMANIQRVLSHYCTSFHETIYKGTNTCGHKLRCAAAALLLHGTYPCIQFSCKIKHLHVLVIFILSVLVLLLIITWFFFCVIILKPLLSFNFFLELLQLPSKSPRCCLLPVADCHQGQEEIVAHQLLVLHPQEEVHVLLEVVVASLG